MSYTPPPVPRENSRQSECCEWCGMPSQVDARGGCVACGGPRIGQQVYREFRRIDPDLDLDHLLKESEIPARPTPNVTKVQK